jgi:site-specific recombinase XerD
LLAIGFAAARRRSELVALAVEDLEEVPEGIRLTVRRSKTDQQGAGYMIAIPAGIRLRPLMVVRTWLDAAGITSGPLFRSINKAGRVSEEGLSGRTVADIVKQYAAAAGFDATEFSGHSLRAGLRDDRCGVGRHGLEDAGRHAAQDAGRPIRLCPRRRGFKDHAGQAFL